MKPIIILFSYLFVVTVLYAQQVTGYVYYKESGDPVVGATVSYKYRNTLNGCTTNINGHYEIKVPEDVITVTFSYVGYITENYHLVISGKRDNYQSVYLRIDAKLLDEVVVSVRRFEQKLSDITVSMEVRKIMKLNVKL